jgi:hypothetical protein
MTTQRETDDERRRRILGAIGPQQEERGRFALPSAGEFTEDLTAALDWLQRNVREPLAGSAAIGAQSPLAPPAFQDLARAIPGFSETAERFGELRQEPDAPFLPFADAGQAFRETDFPSARVDVTPGFDIPLPGGRRLDEVDIGVKGALEAVTDPIELVPGIGIAGSIGGRAAGAAARGARRGASEALVRTPSRTAQDVGLRIAGLRRPAGAAEEGLGLESAVQRLADAIKPAARLTREATELARTGVRKQRVAQLAARQAGAQGEQASLRARGALAGDLPKPEFEPPRIEQVDRDALFGAIDQTQKLRPFDRETAKDGLTKALNGEIPTLDELAKMERVFGVQLIEALLKKRAFKAKLFDEVMSGVNFPKALVSSFDLSAALRQGRPLLTTNPQEFKNASGAMHRALVDERFAETLHEALQTRPTFGFASDAGLYFAPWKSAAARLASREEAYMTRWAEKFPWIRMSERAYITFLNKLRADVFDAWVKNQDIPIEDISIDAARAMARHINWLTGRGSIGALGRGRTAEILNAMFFSPRFVASRLEMPFEVFITNPAVRGRVALDFANFIGSGAMLLALLDVSGLAEVEWDARSSDFGKVKVGNIRYDMWGGLQPIVRRFYQTVTLQGKSLKTGEVFPLERFTGGGKADAIWVQLGRFVQSKFSPTASGIFAARTGESFLGDELEPADEALGRVIPLFLQDVYEVWKETGDPWNPGGLPEAVGRSLPGLYGVGIQAFDSDGGEPPTQQPQVPTQQGETDDQRRQRILEAIR